jgi:hypothetical protein
MQPRKRAPVAAAEAATQQGQSQVRTVTSGRRPGTPAAERKRQQRARNNSALLFEREDWRLFIDPTTLPQKAGCQPQNLRQIVLRELVDNALDEGARVTLEPAGKGWIIADDGPGLDPVDVPRLFAVNRPLLSRKRRRLPLRGMLGNGLRVVVGAVAASEGTLTVETRGHHLTLAVDAATGTTMITKAQQVPFKSGLTVHITLGPLLPQYDGEHDDCLADEAIAIANYGKNYSGPSSPWWYSPRDLHQLMLQVTPACTTVARLCSELGFTLNDDRVARELNRDEATAVLDQLRHCTKPIDPKLLGAIGPAAYGSSRCYACEMGAARMRGAEIPFVVEAWAECTRPEKRGDGSARLRLLLNRTPSAATVLANSVSRGLVVRGCGLQRGVLGPHTANYRITVSVISPYIELATDGKEPGLAPYSEAIAMVLRKACNAAYRAMGKPPGGMSIKDAAWQVMADAYRAASGGGRLPANARQIMYAARKRILELTSRAKLDDRYFTQTLLPDYVEQHPRATSNWDVVFDVRGNFVEPHTGRNVSLGTVEVRQYLGERPTPNAQAALDSGSLSPTTGPENRYSTVLFIEKEGFNALLAQARIAERFDIAIMSTKGMSTTAARLLLDRLAPRIDKVLVAHDFDVSGFSIFGTLASDGRRYRFRNDVNIVDLGLRLADVEALGLDSEPVETSGDWSARATTLATHGASVKEINFLRHRRVELNAMPADVFVRFLERKLTEHGICKVVPPDDVLEQHARDVLARALTNKALDDIRTKAETEAASIALPSELRQQIAAALKHQPDIPWDLAVADIARKALNEDGAA